MVSLSVLVLTYWWRWLLVFEANIIPFYCHWRFVGKSIQFVVWRHHRYYQRMSASKRYITILIPRNSIFSLTIPFFFQIRFDGGNSITSRAPCVIGTPFPCAWAKGRLKRMGLMVPHTCRRTASQRHAVLAALHMHMYAGPR